MYSPNLYLTSDDDKCRYALGSVGKKNLVVIGLNPSTADDKKPDATLRKVIGFVQRHSYDGYIMLNLYPQRATYPELLHKRRNTSYHRKNLEVIIDIVSSSDSHSILAAWGNTIQIRKYLFINLKEIYMNLSSPARWLQIGEGTALGHPRHPSRVAYQAGLKDFDVEKYVNALT